MEYDKLRFLRYIFYDFFECYHYLRNMMKITVIGTGYVGLVTGTCFAETGSTVACVDIDQKKIDALKKGDIPFYEPGLSELVIRNQHDGRLTFSSNLAEAVKDSSVAFICVGTPSRKDGSANLDFVFQAARDIGHASDNIVVAIKSTVPVGTAQKLKELYAQMKKPGIRVVSNPEFLREGNAVEDCLKPDRVVVGTDSKDVLKVFQNLYQPFVRTGNPIMSMDNVSAEMTKYVSNCILATRISFINEMSMLCEKVGADISQVRAAAGADKRIGTQYLFPSIGFGGSCFPKDVRALASLFRDYEMRANILEATLLTNDLQKKNFCRKIKAYYASQSLSISHKKIAVWGAAFKARTDDIRESAALDVIDFLIKEEAKVFVFDPKANDNIRQMYGSQVTCVEDPMEAVKEAFGLCVLTEWNQFRHPDFEKIGSLLSRKVIFDGRNLYDPTEMKDLGFAYHSIGR
jgi:UDPglucose 6-dehydrogenase